jgi:hypothetical protein
MGVKQANIIEVLENLWGNPPLAQKIDAISR